MSIIPSKKGTSNLNFMQPFLKGARAQKIGLKSTYLKIGFRQVLAKKCDVKWLTLKQNFTTNLKKNEKCM